MRPLLTIILALMVLAVLFLNAVSVAGAIINMIWRTFRRRDMGATEGHAGAIPKYLFYGLFWGLVVFLIVLWSLTIMGFWRR